MMSLGLIAFIISLVALAINAVNHFQVQRAIHTIIKKEETYE